MNGATMDEPKVCQCEPPSEYLHATEHGWVCEHCGGSVLVIEP